MCINCVFQLSMTLDRDEFDEVFSSCYCLEDYSDEDEYIDRSMAKKGVVVKFRNSQYKKKVSLFVDAAKITNGASRDTAKLIRKLKKRIEDYFDFRYRLEDFSLSGLTLIADVDAGNRENVSAYLKVLQRLSKVKGFSPAEFDELDEDAYFGLKGNSDAVEFMIFSLEKAVDSGRWIADESQRFKGILRTEVRLTKAKAIRCYTCAYSLEDQIVELTEKSRAVYMDVFARIVPYGDFYKKDAAVEIVRQNVGDIVMRRKMLRLLELIPEKKSLHLAQKAMAYRHPDKLLAEFAKIGLSPVTIGKRQAVKHLKNFYDVIKL